MARPKKSKVENQQEQKEIIPINLEVDKTELDVEIVLGSLVSNAKILRDKIESELTKYSIEKYLNNPEAAKADKAFLNKMIEQVDSKRIEVQKKWNMPLDTFLSEMKEIKTSLKIASDKLKEITDEVDKSERWTKRENIKKYFDSKGFELVSFEKIFIEQWTNKTYDLKKVYSEIDIIIEKINSEIDTLKKLDCDNTEVLIAYYLNCLNLQATLNYSTELKEKKELLQKTNTIQTEIQPIQTKPINDTEQQPPIEQKGLMSFTLKIFGTREQLIALRNYIDSNDIKYEKL